MRNRKVTVAARSKCTCAGWWRWALLDRLHGSTGLRANFGSTVMDTIRRQCHRSGQLHYLFMPQILAVGARDEVHAMRRKKFFGTGLRFGRVRWGASVSQSVIYFTVPPRAAHPTSLRRRVFPFLKIASRVLIQTLASIAQLWIQHSLTVTPRSSARLFSLSINIERRSGPESGVDCRRSPPPGASANREPCLQIPAKPERPDPPARCGVNTHTLHRKQSGNRA